MFSDSHNWPDKHEALLVPPGQLPPSSLEFKLLTKHLTLPTHIACGILQGRCAAVLMFHCQLALLPAMETEGLELDLMMDDPYGDAVEGPGGSPAELVSATVGNSYVVNLAKMGIKQVLIG